MSISRVLRGSGMGVIHAVTEGFVGLAQISILWKYLPSRDVGLWLTFLPLGGIFIAVAAALSQVTSRQVASALGAPIDSNDLPSVLAVSRRVFWVFALVSSVVGAIIFLTFLGPRIPSSSSTEDAAIAWGLLIFGYVLRLFAFRFVGILNGFGFVGIDKLMLAISSLVVLFSTYALLASGWGIVGTGVAQVLAGLALLCLATIATRHRIPSTRNPDELRPKSMYFFLREGAGYMLMSLAAWFMTSTDVLVIEHLFGLETVARYAPLTKVMLLITGVSVLIPQMSFPFIAKAWSAGDRQKCRHLLVFSAVSAIGLALVGSSLALFVMPYVLPIWLHSDNLYLGAPVFAAQLLFAIVYANHNSHASATLATGINPFVWISIANVFLALPLALLLGSAIGILGVPLGYSLGTLPFSALVVYSAWTRLGR